MPESENLSSAVHASASLASSINASRLHGSSALGAETNLASAAIQDSAWAAKVNSLLAPPIVTIDLSDAARKLVADGPSGVNVGMVASAATSGAVISKTV